MIALCVIGKIAKLIGTLAAVFMYRVCIYAQVAKPSEKQICLFSSSVQVDAADITKRFFALMYCLNLGHGVL